MQHRTADTLSVRLCVRPPIAGNDAIFVVNTGAGGDEKFTIDAFELLHNDTDPDGHSLRILGSSVTNATARNTSGDSFVAAEVTVHGDALQVKPVDGYTGVAHFSYRVSDGFAEAEASVTLDIGPWKRSGDVRSP